VPNVITIGIPPKNGSSSVHLCLRKHFGVDTLSNCKDVNLLHGELVSGEAYFIVRDPLSRFLSLWLNKCVDGGRISSFPTQLSGLSQRELFTFIKTHEDHHWIRQVDLLGDTRATVVPLSKLDELWATTGLPLLLRENSAPYSAAIEADLTLELLDYYAADLQLYQESLDND